MVWKRADGADITVQSDYDGYSEAVTVVDGDTVHVDTHATASASASVSQFQPQWSMTGVDYIAYSDSPNTVVGFGGYTIDYTFGVESNSDYVSPEVTVYYADGTSTRILDIGRNDNSWNYYSENNASVDHFELEDGYSGSSSYSKISWSIDVTILQSKSASIDTKNVVTDDIHK